MSPDGSSKVARDQDRTQEGCSWNQEKDRDGNFNDTENRGDIGGDAQVIEHLFLAGKVDEFWNTTGDYEKKSDQTGQGPAGDTLCFRRQDSFSVVDDKKVFH